MAILYRYITYASERRSEPKSTKVASWWGWYRAPTSFSSMVIVMKVVGIDLIKLFPNFKFEKSAVILTGYMAIAGYFFRWLWHEKNLCSAQNRFCAGCRCLCRVESSRNPVSEAKKVKNGARLLKYLTRRKFKGDPYSRILFFVCRWG